MHRGAGGGGPAYPLRRSAQLGPICVAVRMVRSNLPDRGAVRFRICPDSPRRPGPQHAHDESYRGDTAGVHAAWDALGLGDLPRIHGQSGPPGSWGERGRAGALLAAAGLRAWHDTRPGTHLGHRGRTEPDEADFVRLHEGWGVRVVGGQEPGRPTGGRQLAAQPRGVSSKSSMPCPKS